VTLTIVCGLFRGDRATIPSFSRDLYEPSWADKLYRGCARNLERPFRFVVVSDWPQSAFSQAEIDAVPFLHEDRSFMCLNECLRPDLEIDRGLFLGLDTVILGSIDEIASYTGRVALVPFPVDPRILSNPVVPFDGAWGRDVYAAWRADPQGCAAAYQVSTLEGRKPSEQIFWPTMAPDADLANVLWPGQIQSYLLEFAGHVKGIANPGPELARAIYFVAPHRPSNVEHPMIRANWI